MTVESKKESVWKGEWRSGGREILRGEEKKREKRRKKVCVGESSEKRGEWVE